MTREDRIIVDPEIPTGKPVVKGTRIAVEFVIGILAEGWSENEILDNYPGLTVEDIHACGRLLVERKGPDSHAFSVPKERARRPLAGTTQNSATNCRRGIPMRDDFFEQLVASVREGGAVLRGEIEPSRRFEVKRPDVKGIRTNYGLSRKQFAALLGVSPKTRQNLERGRLTPKGAARILLEVAATHPEEVCDAVRRVRGRQRG